MATLSNENPRWGAGEIRWLPTIDSLRTGYHGVFLLLSKGFTKPRRGGQSKKMPVARAVSPKEKAERWAAMIDGEVVKTRADLARKLGVSRARVTQVLGVLEAAG